MGGHVASGKYQYFNKHLFRYFLFLNRHLYYSWVITHSNWIQHLKYVPDLSILRQFIGNNKNCTNSSGSYPARPPRGTVWRARFCSPLWPLLSSPPQQMANGPKVSEKGQKVTKVSPSLSRSFSTLFFKKTYYYTCEAHQRRRINVLSFALFSKRCRMLLKP